jgi:Fe-S-cluster containining protein
MNYSFQQLEKFNKADKTIIEFCVDQKVRSNNIRRELLRTADFSGLLRFSDYKFVIPGKTFYSCIRCANCCIALHSVGYAILDGPCNHLSQNNCNNYCNRYSACRTYPFHIIVSANGIDLLMIDKGCSGYNKGEVINVKRYSEIISQLNDCYSNNDNVEILFMRKA